MLNRNVSFFTGTNTTGMAHLICVGSLIFSPISLIYLVFKFMGVGTGKIKGGVHRTCRWFEYLVLVLFYINLMKRPTLQITY